MDGIFIRQALEKDVSSMTLIYNQAIEERVATCDLTPKTIENRLEWFRQFDFNFPIFVGEIDKKIVCYGCLYPISPKEGYRFSAESGVYVHKEFRGKGLGKKMLGHLLSTAKEKKIHFIQARIFTFNEKSINLHLSFGFNWIGVLKESANLDGQWADVAILSYYPSKN